jgi:hypothetical protein
LICIHCSISAARNPVGSSKTKSECPTTAAGFPRQSIFCPPP